MKVTRKQGFTLIELLVVIVIIGILAGALFGPITGALASARRSGMAQTGRHIVEAIIAAEQSDKYASNAWPSDENTGTAPSSGPNMNQAFSSTEAYFTEALYLKETDAEKRNRLQVLKEISPSDLVAEGYSTATGTTIEDTNCAWVIASNAKRAPGKTPVLVSRNFNCSTFVNATCDDDGITYEQLLTTDEPFGQDGCVLICRDGSANDFEAGDMLMRNLVPGRGSGKLSDIKQGKSQFKFLQSGN